MSHCAHFLWSRRSAEIDKEKEVALEEKLRQLCEDGNVNSDISSAWSTVIALGCRNTGFQAASLAANSSDKEDALSKAEQLRRRYLDQRLSAASRLLVNANYCSSLVRSEADNGTSPTLSVAPMTASLKQASKGLAPAPLPQTTATVEIQKLDSVDGMRQAAWKELQEALSSYETELAAMHAAHKVVGL